MCAPFAPPDLPNETQMAEHRDLKEELKALLRYHEIPYIIWQKLHEERFLTLRDFTKRWGSEADLVREAPADYQFRHDESGFDATKACITLAKLRTATNPLSVSVSGCHHDSFSVDILPMEASN